MDNSHRFKFEETRIIHREPHYLKIKFVEDTLIELEKYSFSQSSVELMPIWLPYLKSYFQNKTSIQKPVETRVNPEVRTHSMKLRDRPT